MPQLEVFSSGQPKLLFRHVPNFSLDNVARGKIVALVFYNLRTNGLCRKPYFLQEAQKSYVLVFTRPS